MSEALQQTLDVYNNGSRFAYYTSADTALQILRNSELWFRNATVMNDFSEIAYGVRMITEAFNGPEGERFRTTISDIFPDAMKRIKSNFEDCKFDWQTETYLACVSLHDVSEDQHGRLSIWRAYGDTALIVKNTPMVAVTNDLGVFSIPVQYIGLDGMTARLGKVTDAITDNKAYLEGLGEETLINHVHQMLYQFAIATKHPGFAEEREWRLFYRPSERTSPGMKQKIVVIQGTPQKVWALGLESDPAKGLHGAGIPDLLDRIIIGPTEYRYVSVQAFAQVLEEVGVSDAKTKVIASDIPLRT